MMRCSYAWLFFMFVTAIQLSGCGSDKVAPTGSADSTSAKTPPTAGQTSAAEPSVTEPRKAEQPGAEGSSSAQPNTADSEPASMADTGPRDPLLEGIENQQVLRDFPRLKAEADQQPEDPLTQLSFVGILFHVGRLHEDQQRGAKAEEAYLAAASNVDKLVESKSEIPEDLDEFVAAVYFHAALVHAKRDQTEATIAALNKSVDFGLNNFALMDEREELAALRESGHIASLMEAWQTRSLDRAFAQHEPFPFDFSLTDVDGKPIQLADYKGQVVIADIWGTWCGPCRMEIPSFIKLQDKYGAEGFQMVGLNEEEGPPEETTAVVKKYMNEVGINYPCALITPEVRDQVPEFGGYPTTLFIDRTGTVRLKVTGVQDYALLELAVKKLLAEPRP